MNHACQTCEHPADQHHAGRCNGQVTDYYGTWNCLCVGFELDGDQ